MKICRISISFFVLLLIFVEPVNSRKRKIITGSGNSYATGNKTNTNTVLQGVQGDNNEVGVNFTSQGSASGENNIWVGNSAAGSVDYQNGTNAQSSGMANVGATGEQVTGTSNISGEVLGNNQVVDSHQDGKANGAGSSSANINGSAAVLQNGQVSPFSTDDLQISAGASGNQSSGSEVSSDQNLSWNDIYAQLAANANGQGANNSDANIGISATNDNGNAVSVNGGIGGTGEQVSAQANGSALLQNNTQDTGVNLDGVAAGQGSSSMVATGQLGTHTDTDKSLQTFGDGKAAIDQGQSGIESSQEGTLNSENGGQATNHMNVSADSNQKNLTISNGIQVNDQNGQTLAVGGGTAQGVGSQNSSAIMTVDTQYDHNGQSSVVVQGDGTAVSQNDTSALIITANGQLQTSNGINNTGTAIGMGTASGEYNNVTGNAFLNIDDLGSNGNAYVNAIGGGKGPADANTQAILQLNDGLAGKRNETVSGSVSAKGDQTYVQSISGITDYAGIPTYSTYQNATAHGGSSHSSTGSVITVGRKKRQVSHQDSHLSPVVQEFSIMKICPDAETANKDCPVFKKVYDSISGLASWEHIEVGELVKMLFGYPVSKLSDSGISATQEAKESEEFNDMVLAFAKGNDASARTVSAERKEDSSITNDYSNS